MLDERGPPLSLSALTDSALPTDAVRPSAVAGTSAARGSAVAGAGIGAGARSEVPAADRTHQATATRPENGIARAAGDREDAALLPTYGTAQPTVAAPVSTFASEWLGLGSLSHPPPPPPAAARAANRGATPPPHPSRSPSASPASDAGSEPPLSLWGPLPPSRTSGQRNSGRLPHSPQAHRSAPVHDAPIRKPVSRQVQAAVTPKVLTAIGGPGRVGHLDGDPARAFLDSPLALALLRDGESDDVTLLVSEVRACE